MPWTRLDDQFHTNPKLTGLRDGTFRLYVNALVWSVANLTDGRIPRANVPSLVPVTRPQYAYYRASQLVTAGLWKQDGDDWIIHNFGDYQLTKDEILAKRKVGARRQALARSPELRDEIRNRDRDRCRYCGTVVDFKDRRSVRGGTYDHVNPEGDNTLANLVVACRGCNSSKRDRTPDEAGMTLDPVSRSDLDTGSARNRTHPNPSQPTSKSSPSLTHTLTDTLNGPPETEDGESDWAFPPEGAITDLWQQALITTLHHQDTSTIRDPHAYTAAIYRNLLTEHHANLENNALVDAIADCPECDTNGLRWSTAANKPTSRDAPDAVSADRCNHIRAVV